jgi:hypothetical protein
MRIAAGVLLIIVALANLFGGLAYAGLGGLAGVVGSNIEEGGEQIQGNDDPDAQQAGEGIAEAGDDLQKAGGMIALWGVFLILLGGMNIAGAVMLFSGKNAQFALIVGVVEVIADLGTMGYFQTFIFSGIGLIAGVLTILAAKEMASPPPADLDAEPV